MKSFLFRLAATLCSIAILAGCGGSEQTEKSEPESGKTSPKTETPASGLRAEINAFVDTVLAYYDRNDIEGLLLRGAAPEDITMMEYNGTWDRNIRRYGMFKDYIVTALMEVKASEPEFNADSTVASYQVENAPLPMVFKKIDSVWYFGDKEIE